MKLFLDNAATTKLKPEVKDTIINLLDDFYNPSSLYSGGIEVRKIIEDTRKNVAKFINAKPENIYFTSSGSASNTLAIKGYKKPHTIYYSPLLHKSALKCLDDEITAHKLRVNKCGLIDVSFLDNEIKDIEYPPLVIVEYANSEIGTIQNIKEISEIVHKHNGVIYVDCTGSISTIPLDVKKINIDVCGFSAHKIGSLKGCGVLYKKTEIELEPLVYGTQEKGLFGGTENVLGIAALGTAVKTYDYSSISNKQCTYVYDYIMKNILGSYLVGTDIEDHRLPHNLYMCFKGVRGESLMILLDMNGIQVSTGSACSSGSQQPSSTLTEIGMDEDDINSCIRITFSGDETMDEIQYFCTTLKNCVNQLRFFST